MLKPNFKIIHMNNQKIVMVDLRNQYQKLKPEINQAMQEVMDATSFIKGRQVFEFEQNLAQFTGTKHVISCGNGTDAIQIALMALDLRPNDEIIVPAFTYVATIEVIALLGLKPIMVDVNPETFNIDISALENAITPTTKAVIPVHLFGQCSDMEPILNLAEKHGLYVIEDNAQALGADYTFSNGLTKQTGTIGHIGCNSFFPTKNLGCFGDGGAIFTDDAQLAEKIRMVANHGQKQKYHHDLVGCNSRLDTLQAAILDIKLKYLNEHLEARQKAASFYDEDIKDLAFAELPLRMPNATHTFNQYTLKVKNGRRDELQSYLAGHGIPSMIYYPLPLYKQVAYRQYVSHGFKLPVTEYLCQSVLSIPIHTEIDETILTTITNTLKSFK